MVPKRKNEDVDDEISRPSPLKTIKSEASIQTFGDNTPELTHALEVLLGVLPQPPTPDNTAVEDTPTLQPIDELSNKLMSKACKNEIEVPRKIRDVINNDEPSTMYYFKHLESLIKVKSEHLSKSDRETWFKEMREYLKDIQQLALMVKGLQPALDLAILLCSNSFKEQSIVPISQVDVDACKECDKVVYLLCRRLKAEDLEFNKATMLAAIMSQKAHFESGSDGDLHLQHTYNLLWSLIEGPQAVEDIYKKSKSEIAKQSMELLKLHRKEDGSYAPSIGKPLSKSVSEHLQTVKRLMSMDHGLSHAFDLVIHIGHCMFAALGSITCSKFGDWPLKSEMDDLFSQLDALSIEIIPELRVIDPDFRPTCAMGVLAGEIEHFMLNLRTPEYFGQTYRLLSDWMPEAEQARLQPQYDLIHARIAEVHVATEKTLQYYIENGIRPSLDLMGEALSPITTDIEDLGRRLGGRWPAIKLTVSLAECSYAKIEGLGPLYDAYSNMMCTRKFDEIVDMLLSRQLAKARRNNQMRLPDKDVIDRINNSIEYAAQYGIATHLKRTQRYLGNWQSKEQKRNENIET